MWFAKMVQRLETTNDVGGRNASRSPEPKSRASKLAPDTSLEAGFQVGSDTEYLAERFGCLLSITMESRFIKDFGTLDQSIC